METIIKIEKVKLIRSEYDKNYGTSTVIVELLGESPIECDRVSFNLIKMEVILNRVY